MLVFLSKEKKMANKAARLFGKGGAVAILACLAALCISCHKVCRCYAYSGTVDEYSQEELDRMGHSCSGMEDADYGLVYSICEWDE